MKNLILLFTFCLLLLQCTSKKKVTAESTEPTAAQLTALQAKFPEASMATLQEGHSLYYGACTKCHGAKDINRRSEEEWPKILDRMAPRAKLTDAQKDAVYKYVMSVKLSPKPL